MTTSYQVMNQDGDYVENGASFIAHAEKQRKAEAMSNPVVNDASDRASALLDEVECELSRAMALHGPIKTEHDAYGVILEEVDEFWDEVKVNPKKLSVEAQAERIAHMKAELIQVAAMALRTIIDLELD